MIEKGYARWYYYLENRYNPITRQGKKRRDQITALTRTYLPTSSKNILDIGCGMGVSSLAMAKLGHKVLGIDAVPEHIQKARLQAKQEKFSIHFQMADVMTLEKLDIKPDVITFWGDVIPHFSMKDLSLAVSKLVKHMPSGGMILFHYTDSISFIYQGYKEFLLEETAMGDYLTSYHIGIDGVQGTYTRLYIYPKSGEQFEINFHLWAPWSLAYVLENEGFSNVRHHHLVGGEYLTLANKA